MPRFLRLLDRQTPGATEIHVIVDNSHKHPPVWKWIGRRPRFHVHFTPTNASWLNMGARFFRDLSEKALRRADYSSVDELVAAFHAYLGAPTTILRPS